MKVIWTKEALKRLSEIEEFIAQDNPNNAEKFINYLVERGESIPQNPQIGRIVPEISNPTIREIISKKYRIVYRIKKKLIEIITVFEGHKLLSIDEMEID